MAKLWEIFVTGGWSEKHRAHYRPVWQVILLAPVAAVYYPANAFVEWCDRNV